MTEVLLRGKYGHRDIQGECHVTMEEKIGVVCLQSQGIPKTAPQKAGRGKEGSYPRAFRVSTAVNSLISDF